MGLPNHIFFVRHGESEGNVALNAAKKGDYSHFTEEFMNHPGRGWALSPTGVLQAQAAGAWLQEEKMSVKDAHRSSEERFYVSPLVRTKQTAAHLGLQVNNEDPPWRLNRSLRERDWGDIELLTKKDYRKRYSDSAKKEFLDPLYWRPPGGESIADVAENRVRNFLDTLHRECEHQKVIVVTHGEFIRAVHLVFSRANDETYAAWDNDPAMRISNCEVWHYTRIDPISGVLADHLTHFRRHKPVLDESGWTMELVQDWTFLNYEYLTNEELLA